MQRGALPRRPLFFAPQPGQIHCTNVPSGVYSATVRVTALICRFCRYPVPMSDLSCSRALLEERTAPQLVKGQAFFGQREERACDTVRAGSAVCMAKNAKDRRYERSE